MGFALPANRVKANRPSGLDRQARQGDIDDAAHDICGAMRRIYEKVHMHSKSEAIAKALRDRLV